ncbi:MAG: phosphate ABC transporter permease subunit PstC [Leptolyngbya sp. SIO3F4]|nr:phosphate ABC transporter permease subunit PstC [Leptolyngbya sp. SIO3F4]
MISSSQRPPNLHSAARSRKRGRRVTERLFDQGFISLTQILAIAVSLILVVICITLTTNALPAIQALGLKFLVTNSWNPVEGRETYGALSMIYGTLASSVIALTIAGPLALGTAICLSEDFIPIKLRTILIFLVELLAAIPSIVYGLWGIFVLIPITKEIGTWLHNTYGWIPLFSTAPVGPGLFPASLVLAVMILPIITTISREALTSLPPELRQASLGLGATRWYTIFRVLVPAAFSGIIGAVILALGRAMGETMAVTMLIGNANQVNVSVLAPANTIASLLANQFAEADGLQVSALMYAALVLIAMSLAVNLLTEWIVNQVKHKY